MTHTHPIVRRTRIRSAVFATVAISASAHAQPVTYRVVAYEGQQAPGLPSGVLYTGFGLVPALNEDGRVTFSAGLSGGHGSALWVENAALVPEKVVQSGDPVPGIPGATFAGSASAPRQLNIAGQTAFSREFQLPGGGMGHAIWIGGTSGISAVAFAGDQAPGTPTGVSFGDSSVPRLNDAADIVWFGFLQGVDITVDNEEGIWARIGASPLALLARENDPAPGTTGRFRLLTRSPAINNQGHVLFTGELRGPGTGSASDHGIWGEMGSGVTLLLREGDAASAAGAGVHFGDFFEFELNDSDHYTFASTLQGTGVTTTNDAAIWVARGSGMDLIARESNFAAGTTPGVTYGGTLREVRINAASRVAFLGSLAGTGVTTSNDMAIWREGASGLELIVREGDPIPGTGAIMRTLYDPVYFNAHGQLAFEGQWLDVAPAKRSLWATDAAGNLVLVALEGQVFDVDEDPVNTDLRTSVGFEILSEKFEPFNDRGDLVFRVYFTDGTRALIVANIPATPPACAADYNGDTESDILDFLDFMDDFGACGGEPAPCGTFGEADFTGDTIVDVLDFLAFMDAFATGC